MRFHVEQTIVTTATSIYEIEADSPADAIARFNDMTEEQREEQQIDFHESENVQTAALPADDADGQSTLEGTA